MRTSIIATLAAAALGAAAAAQSRSVDVEPFTSISVRGHYVVEVEIGDAHAVSVQGSAEDAERVSVGVRNGVLRLRQRGRSIFRRRPQLDVRVMVTAPALNALSFGEGASAVVSDLNSTTLEVSVATGASARLTGTCSTVDYRVSTGGSLSAENLQCENVEISASTGGSADVYASVSLDARASTGGDVDVFGRPGRTDVSASLGGDVSVR